MRDLIEQVLFTAPGERVNRPEFGCGLKQLVFAPASDALAAATEQLVHGALIRWLDPVISVEKVAVDGDRIDRSRSPSSMRGAIPRSDAKRCSGNPFRPEDVAMVVSRSGLIWCEDERRSGVLREPAHPLNGIDYRRVSSRPAGAARRTQRARRDFPEAAARRAGADGGGF